MLSVPELEVVSDVGVSLFVQGHPGVQSSRMPMTKYRDPVSNNTKQTRKKIKKKITLVSYKKIMLVSSSKMKTFISVNNTQTLENNF